MKTTEHTEVWTLLPWLVNGRIGEADRLRIEAHLAQCADCREERAAQQRLCEVVAADAPFEQLPAAGLAKLHRRIEREPAAAGSPTGTTRSAPHVRSLRRRRLALAASMAAIAVMAALAVGRYGAHRGVASDYYTVTSPAPQAQGAVIRAVFSPAMTVAQLQALLDGAHLRIVSGPTEAGVYSLSMNGSPSAAWSLQHLRAQDGVRFAEAIAPAGAE